MLIRSLAILFFLSACESSGPEPVQGLPFFDSPEFTPKWHKPNALPPNFHQVPEFSLQSHQDTNIDQSALDGQITVVNFFFSRCPGICPKLLKSLKTIDSQITDVPNLLLLSHSVTPKTDTVAMLKQYAKKNKVTSKRWHFLTGDRSLIYKMAREVYFSEEDLGVNRREEDFLHTENFVLLDGNRHLRGVYNGITNASVQQLIADIRTLAQEK